MNPLILQDNSIRTLVGLSPAELALVRTLSETPIRELPPGTLFIGGNNVGNDRVCDLTINQLQTHNIVGFVGLGDASLTIQSRFTQADGNDYFFHYMLSRVFSLNLVDLPHPTSDCTALDLLKLLFPHFLQQAVVQGIYKTYVRHEHNDSRLKGPLDVARHLRLNLPANGRIAYHTREHSTDNAVTQLVRHAIELIAQDPLGPILLSRCRPAVDLIRQATPTYSRHDRDRVLRDNLSPLVHPYYTAYAPLQRLCLQILRHERLRFGEGDNQLHGILFDAAWLWEEYLATLLPATFQHPTNKSGRGGVRLYDNESRRIYPDFYSSTTVLDAKYKRQPSDADHLQILAYMFRLKLSEGGFIFPTPENNPAIPKQHTMDTLYQVREIPLPIPQQADSFADFVAQIKNCHVITNYISFKQ